MRCEGYHLHPAFGIGGGTGRWEQCTNEAIWRITFKRDGKKQTLPACEGCKNKTGTQLDPVDVIKVERIRKRK